jgi:hypothetical protein
MTSKAVYFSKVCRSALLHSGFAALQALLQGAFVV